MTWPTSSVDASLRILAGNGSPVPCLLEDPPLDQVQFLKDSPDHTSVIIGVIYNRFLKSVTKLSYKLSTLFFRGQGKPMVFGPYGCNFL